MICTEVCIWPLNPNLGTATDYEVEHVCHMYNYKYIYVFTISLILIIIINITMLSLLCFLMVVILGTMNIINGYITTTNPFNKIIKRSSTYNTLKSTTIKEITTTITTTTTTQPIDTSHITYNDMNSYQLKSINEYDFDESILDKDIVVCLFQAQWAGVCKTMEKTLITEVMPLYNNHDDIQFIKIDTDNCNDLVHQLSIRSIPSTLIFKNGKIVSEIIGSVSGDVVNQHLSHVNSDESFQ